MLIRNEYIGNIGILGIWKITENDDELLNLLPRDQQHDANLYVSKMRSRRRISEWLATRVLLYNLLGDGKIIDNHPDGKPFLTDNSYNISISHTKDYVAILLSEQYTVGVDVETISDRISNITEKFLSPDEFIDSSQKIIHLLLHWSAKETMFKLLEEGEVYFKEHLHIESFKPDKSGSFHAVETKTKKNKTYQIHYEVLSDVVLTWAIDK